MPGLVMTAKLGPLTAVALLGALNAEAADIKDWSLVCTRSFVGRVAALAKAGDTSEAYALSQAAGSLCGDPWPAGNSSILVFDSGGEFVQLLISDSPGSPISLSDRFTPRWNLAADGKGALAKGRESSARVQKMLADDWAKECNKHSDANLRALCLARPDMHR
jgi:hypothetical protein